MLASPDPEFAAKVAWLARPDAYPDNAEWVETRETHLSWVFLTESRAYKLKKPVRTALVDLTSLKARERICREEVRLNRRLAASVYHRVVPLTRDGSFRLGLGGVGAVVDWLVEMRRLSDGLMLDAQLRAGVVSEEHIATVATLLGGFYETADRVPISPELYVARFETSLRESEAALGRPRYRLPFERFEPVFRALKDYLNSGHAAICARAAEGRIRDGHGDLRPEHICLERPPVIIDCLEFSSVLRAVDPAFDLAFLAMECEMLGAAWVGPILFSRCAAEAQAGPALIGFYKGIQALTRARLAIEHLDDVHPRTPEKWPRQCLDYLAAAGPSCSVSVPDQPFCPGLPSAGPPGD